MPRSVAVSYTHLDVYKRQDPERVALRVASIVGYDADAAKNEGEASAEPACDGVAQPGSNTLF